MPYKGYVSVNFPSGLYINVKTIVKNCPCLGYRSVTEFVADATRRRIEQLNLDAETSNKDELLQ